MAARHFGRIAALATAVALSCLMGTNATAKERNALTITPVPSAPISGAFTLTAVGDMIYLRPMLATIERK